MSLRVILIGVMLAVVVLPIGLPLAGCQDNPQTSQQLRYQDPLSDSYYRYYYGDNEDAYSLLDQPEQSQGR